jgi:hypothetical protein
MQEFIEPQQPEQHFPRSAKTMRVPKLKVMIPIIGVVVVAIAAVAVSFFQAQKEGPVAPTAPQSQPQAAQLNSNTCTLTFAVVPNTSTPSSTATRTPSPSPSRTVTPSNTVTPSRTLTPVPSSGSIAFCKVIEQCGEVLSNWSSIPSTTFSMTFSSTATGFNQTVNITTAQTPNTSLPGGYPAYCSTLQVPRIANQTTQYSYSKENIDSFGWNTQLYFDTINPIPALSQNNFCTYGGTCAGVSTGADGLISLTNTNSSATVIVVNSRICQPTTPPTNTPTRTPTATATRTPTNTPTNSPTPTRTPTNTPTNTPTRTPTPSNTPTRTPTFTITPTFTATATFSPSATATLAIGPTCNSITMTYAAGEPNRPVKLGDIVNFTCGTITGANRYEFRLRIGTNDWITIPSVGSSQTSGPYTINEYGQYTAQCRGCINASCQPWE